MTQPAQEPNPLLVNGPLVLPSAPISLHSGWNWFGYHPNNVQNLTQSLNSVSGRFNLVLGEQGTYAPPPANPAFNTLNHQEPGRGYLVRMTQPGSLTYPASMTARFEESAAGSPEGCDVQTTPYFTHFFGTLQYGDTPAPVGTQVEAMNPRGDVVGCFQVISDGLYGYLRVYGEDMTATPPIPGMRAGEPVSFRLNGTQGMTEPPQVAWTDDKGIHMVDIHAEFAIGEPGLFFPSIMR